MKASTKRNKLLLVTNTFPFGHGESFIENEVQYLSESFDEVYILPVNANDINKEQNTRLLKLPINVRVVESYEKSFSYKRGVFSCIFNEFSNSITLKKLANRDNLRLFFGSLKRAMSCYDSFEEILKKYKLENQVVYSYWGEFWNVPFISLKRKYGFSLVSRFHGYDVYYEVHPNEYFPFKPYLLNNLNGVYPISERGLEYLNNRFAIKNDLACYRLGIKPHDFSNEFNDKGKGVNIVSCAGMKEVKQIHLLIEALCNLSISVVWNHMGDGPLRKELEEKAQQLPSNVQWTFHGNVSNQEVHQFYKEHPVDLFVNSSKSEGIPVAIMEAMSYGVPVVAPNVGGISEIVTSSDVGWLLSEKVTAEEIKNAIVQYNVMEEAKKLALRQSARKEWAANYDASVNYPKFASLIKTL